MPQAAVGIAGPPTRTRRERARGHPAASLRPRRRGGPGLRARERSCRRHAPTASEQRRGCTMAGHRASIAFAAMTKRDEVVGDGRLVDRRFQLARLVSINAVRSIEP